MLAGAFAVLLTGCRPDAADTPGSAAAREAIPVNIARAEPVPMERTVTAFGSLVALDQATVSIKTTGRLRTLAVDVGSPVKAGDVLAQVEPRDYELRLQQAAALLAQARARLGLPIEGEDDSVDPEQTSIVREARARLDEAAANLARERQLQSDRVSSQAQLERAEAEHLVTLNRHRDALLDVRERQAVLAQRRAEFAIAQQQLTDTSLRAPFDGVVQARLTNVGEFLTSGSPVVSLVRVDPLRLRLEIPERQAPLVRVGQPVRMRLDGHGGIHHGVLARVSPALDERTRMLLVEAELKNPGHLKPGAFARAEVVVEAAAPALGIPLDALVTFAGTEKAFTIQTNRAVERRVTTGRRHAGQVEILQGLKAGDPVVRNPGGLQSGDPVRVQDDSPPPATAALPRP